MSMGEYETPGASLSQWATRASFLNLLPKLAPKVVEELSSTLLSSFQSAKTDCFRLINEWDCIKVCCDGNARGDARYEGIYSAEQVKFYQELTAWADTHHLNARWLIDAVILQLDWWIKYPKEVGKSLALGLEYYETWFGEEEPFRFEYPEWRYREQSEHNYRQAIEKHFSEELNLYLTSRYFQAIASGDQRVKRRRKRGEINPEIRLEWFVLYQVVGLEVEQILGGYTRRLSESATPKQVNDAKREMSALIGLPLRPARRGRPKKKR
jgi:hypothetical protein